MCIIIWAPKGEIPNEQLVNAMHAHSDGWGFAVQWKDRLKTFRTTDPKRLTAAWFNRPDGPVLFHARWATHGEVTTENCHPFCVPGHGLVVAHNGILHGFGSQHKSDTLDYIERVLAPLPKGWEKNATILHVLGATMPGSKMVVLGRKDKPTIINEADGLWRDGRWYSNGSAFRSPKADWLEELTNHKKDLTKAG